MNYERMNQELDTAIEKLEAMVYRWKYIGSVCGFEKEAEEHITSIRDIISSLLDRYV